jgi:hypothetical protein
MSHTNSSKRVYLGQAIGNVDPSGNFETRGALVAGEMDITSYDNGGESVSAAELGLNEIYNAQFQAEELDTYAVRSVTIAADRKSAVVNIDTAGSGTEVSAATDVGRHSFMAWGEMLGSGTN